MKRTCGSCTLCCQLIPVEEIKKVQNERCGALDVWKRCKVYSHRPMSCRVWNCAWIEGHTTARPDQVHYVIDIAYDMIKAQDDNTGEAFPIRCRQIWVDPRFPEAVHTQELLDFLEQMGEPAIARYSREDATFIIPRGYGGAKEFEFRTSECVEEIKW